MGTREQEQVEGARTQSLFREVNERIDEITQAHEANGEVLCECASRECTMTIPLTRDEYEAVRRFPTHFFVAPGHVVSEIERLVEQNERYVVVEKIGEAGNAAVKLDPRSR